MAEDPKIGPAPPSGADFFLPKRGAEALDAAKIAVVQPAEVDGTNLASELLAMADAASERQKAGLGGDAETDEDLGVFAQSRHEIVPVIAVGVAMATGHVRSDD